MQAEDVIDEFNRAGYWSQPIVTEVIMDARFHPGEAYHQNYFERNPDQGYCTLVIAPKLADFRKKFLSRLRS
ncbi:MAG: peptide-methionine (S)-S-oxide reductase [Pseudomonadota bacterium]|nr:peptide-methionine (S)-S-oxide reductase [Pseudomonadota bacterium]